LIKEKRVAVILLGTIFFSFNELSSLF